MAKAPITEDSETPAPTPVLDAIETDSGPQFVLDQMCDTLERARIDAQGRTDDLTIRWCHGDDQEDGPRVFSVHRDGAEPQHGLSVDEAKVALDAFGAEA